MSAINTLEQLASDVTLSEADLTQQQKDEIIHLKQQAAVFNANMIITDPEDPDNNPDPDRVPGI